MTGLKRLGSGFHDGGSARVLLVAAVLMGLLLPFTAHFPAFWRMLFCAPTAAWAAALLHAPWMATDQGYLIVLPDLSVHVTQACSAARFFCLLWSLMGAIGMAGGGFGVRRRKATSSRRTPKPTAAAYRPNWIKALRAGLMCIASLAGYGLLAYVLTLLANTARVLLGWWAGLWARHALPEPFYGGVHLAAGLCVFTMFLVIGYAAAVWLSDHRVHASGGTSEEPIPL